MLQTHVVRSVVEDRPVGQSAHGVPYASEYLPTGQYAQSFAPEPVAYVPAAPMQVVHAPASPNAPAWPRWCA